MLSAIAHRELEIAAVAVEAISSLSEEQERLYLDVILNALPAIVRRRLEARMIKGYQYQSDFARKYYGQGLEEGRDEGLRAAVLTIARSKLGPLSDSDITEIEAVSNKRILTELISVLGQARSARKARAALDRALAGERRT